MNLYLISQNVNGGYDTYDSAVVAAKTPAEARKIHPDGGLWETRRFIQSWAKYEDVRAKLIGTAKPGTAEGVICASFNAG